LLAAWVLCLSSWASAEDMCTDTASSAVTGSLADSGGTSSNYGNSETCSFLITATSGGAITLDFSSFSYETSYDFLRIYDGTSTSGTLLANFTGTGSAPDVVASSGSMYIVHDTDSIVTQSGFAATWSIAGASGGEERVCVDSSASAETGTVTDSGGSAGNYQNNESCGLLIQPGTGGAVTLSFSAFNYESSYDFLYVYDGTSSAGTLLGSFTGTSLPPNLTANSGSMFLLASTDSSVVRSGFVADWSTGAASDCPPENLADSFDSVSYAGSNGSAPWASDWVEIGESDGPSAGIARVNASLCSADNCLRIGEPGSASTWSNRGVYREADLSGATSATLSFNYRSGRNSGSESVALAVSDDGGSSWTTLQTYSITSTNFTANPESFDISAFANADFRLRFLSSGNNAQIGMYIDDLRIDFQPTCVPTPVAEWHFDEGSWSGASGEAVDQVGSFDGTAVGGLTTTGDGRICRAAEFDGIDDRLSIGNLQLLLGDTASLSYWQKTTQSGNDTRWTAPGLTGIEAAGGVDDGFWGYLTASGRSAIGIGDGTAAISSTATNDGTWHHVVVTKDGTNGELKVYVDGALENTVTGSVLAVTRVFDEFGVIIDTSGVDDHLDATIDEVLIFDSVLDDEDVTYIYDNQVNGKDLDGVVRNCPVVGAAALLISHDGSGIHCLDEPVTVTAVDGNNAVVPGYAGTIVLDTQSGRGSWSLAGGSGVLTDATPDDGLAEYAFAGGDNGVATFSLSYPEGDPDLDIDVYQQNDTALRDNDAEGTLAFAPSGFTITASALSNPPPATINDPIGTQVAGSTFALHIAAFGTTDTDAQCGVIEGYSGNRTLGFALTRADPATGTVAATVNGASMAVVPSAPSSATITFSNGQAVASIGYRDAGRISVAVSDAASYSHSLAGAANDFVVRPAGLVVSAVTDTAGGANPGAGTMAGAGFVAAGANFRATVQAVDTLGGVTPNFGLEAAPEGVRLRSSALVAPAGGRNGSTGDLQGGATLVRTAAGTFSSSTVSFDEVGIITLEAEISDGDYLGTGTVPAVTSGNVGRFYPDRFGLSLGAVTAPCGDLLLQGQDALRLQYTLQALTTSGAVTQNYDAGLIAAGNLATVLRTAEDADSGTALDARLSAGTATWGLGTLAELDTGAVFARGGAPDGPFDTLQLGLRVNDSLDGRLLSGLDQNTSTVGGCAAAGNCSSRAIGSAIQVRYGRLQVLRGASSEVADLSVPLLAEYFDGVGFRHNQLDQCSTYAAASVTLSDFQESLGSGETAPNGPGSATALVSGKPDPASPLRLSAPGPGNEGSVQLQVDVPGWLEFDWLGTGVTDPAARQTFGLFRGHDRVVYWRER
jgi:hypothetical protein